MHRERIREMMRDERRQIRRLLERLSDDQWQAPSLCEGWTVRDVVAHLVAWDDLLLYRSRAEHHRVFVRFMTLYSLSLASMDRLNTRLDARVRDLSSSELLHCFAADDGPDLKWLFDGSNPGGHLCEYVIHHQDISGALGVPAEVPNDRMGAALDGLTKLPGVGLRARRSMLRHRWRATDLDWTAGRGPSIEAPAATILMTLAGRARRPVSEAEAGEQ